MGAIPTRLASSLFRHAAEIDQSLKALADAERALQGADDDAGRAAAQAIADARARLLAARQALTSQVVSR